MKPALYLNTAENREWLWLATYHKWVDYLDFVWDSAWFHLLKFFIGSQSDFAETWWIRKIKIIICEVWKSRIFRFLTNYFYWIFVLCFDICLCLAKLILIFIHFTTDIKLSQLSKSDETIWDFLCKLGIKPLVRLLKISIFFTK